LRLEKIFRQFADECQANPSARIFKGTADDSFSMTQSVRLAKPGQATQMN
jgi:hypothetical protein